MRGPSTARQSHWSSFVPSLPPPPPHPQHGAGLSPKHQRQSRRDRAHPWTPVAAQQQSRAPWGVLSPSPRQICTREALPGLSSPCGVPLGTFGGLAVPYHEGSDHVPRAQQQPLRILPADALKEPPGAGAEHTTTSVRDQRARAVWAGGVLAPATAGGTRGRRGDGHNWAMRELRAGLAPGGTLTLLSPASRLGPRSCWG